MENPRRFNQRYTSPANHSTAVVSRPISFHLLVSFRSAAPLRFCASALLLFSSSLPIVHPVLSLSLHLLFFHFLVSSRSHPLFPPSTLHPSFSASDYDPVNFPPFSLADRQVIFPSDRAPLSPSLSPLVVCRVPALAALVPPTPRSRTHSLPHTRRRAPAMRHPSLPFPLATS